MMERIFFFESIRVRQRAAPLLKEREQYLSHMLHEGVSKQRVRTIAAMLLNVMRLMDVTSLRVVTIEEIDEGSQRWLTDTESHKTRQPGRSSAYAFWYTARGWFRFHHLIQYPVLPADPVLIIINDFLHFLRVTRGMSIKTIRSCSSRVRLFLRWAMVRTEHLSKISLQDVDEFLEVKRASGCLPRTIASYCAAFRMFFRYTEQQGLNQAKIAHGIHSPRISRYDGAPKGPLWRDVRRMLDFDFGAKKAELRAAAIFSLCSIYALRGIEVVNLMLSDFDWVNETFTVRRAKRGRVQQFPIQFEVGETILRYLQEARPSCRCRNLFVTLSAPHRPVQSATLWMVIGPRMKQLGISSEHYGAHSLRHACATQLLNKGSSLQDIADFLGHRDMSSVSIYAKYDVRSLRQVATFSLAGVR
jgi:integrase/recombinase XerD